MSQTSQNLPQLYRFCFLMTGEVEKAQEAFQATLREAAFRSSRGEPPPDRLWFFREARGRCLHAGEQGLQAEQVELEEHDISPSAPAQISKLDVNQLAIWISAAPDPQRTALALFYLDEFSHREILAISGLKIQELSNLLGAARRQFQAWMDATVPHEELT